MIIAVLATALTLLSAGANSRAILAAAPSPYTPTPFSPEVDISERY